MVSITSILRILIGQSTFWIFDFVILLINLFAVSVNLQYQWIYSISIFNCTWIPSFLLRRYQEQMIHSYFIVTHLSRVERHRQVLYIIYSSTQALDVCSSLRDSKRGGVCVSCEGNTTFWGQPAVGPTAIWEQPLYFDIKIQDSRRNLWPVRRGRDFSVLGPRAS